MSKTKEQFSDDNEQWNKANNDAREEEENAKKDLTPKPGYVRLDLGFLRKKQN